MQNMKTNLQNAINPLHLRSHHLIHVNDKTLKVKKNAHHQAKRSKRLLKTFTSAQNLPEESEDEEVEEEEKNESG
jgi:hypothetical protein